MAKIAGDSPRTLADDILLLSYGNNLNSFLHSFNALHVYLRDLGSKVAPDKSLTFSTNPDFRTKLASHHWPDLGSKIVVKLQFRDLGSHTNLSFSKSGSTLTKRLRGAVQSCKRIRGMPHDYKTKNWFVLGAALNKGLYGVEATWANETALATLTTAVVSTIAPNSSLTCNAWFLVSSLTRGSQTPWPYVFFAVLCS